MEKLNFIATTTFGLESVVKKEAQALGFEDIQVQDGMVNFSGDFKTLVKANLWLRSADKVLLVVGKFKATTFDDLFEGTKSLNWSRFISKNTNFLISGKSVNSKLSSVPACQKITEKAIIESLKTKYTDITYFSKSGPKCKIQIALLKDIATLTINTSGEALHKRGYREVHSLAPLKETLAAALINLSYWRKDKVLLDPLCGSGTIPIEAAMIGRNIAPGLLRKFASEEWEIIPKNIWSEERKNAYKQIDLDTNIKIFGSDISQKAIEIAKENAEIAGVLDCIKFEQKPLNNIGIKNFDYGICICNPPYAERIGILKDVEDLYIHLGKIFSTNKTWSSYVLTSCEDFEKLYGKKANKKRKLFNGNIKVDYYQFFGEKPLKSTLP